MAEYVTQDELRAEMAEFRLEIREGFAAMRTEMAERELRLERSLTRAATIGGLIGGFVASIPAYVAVTMALIRVFSAP